MSNNELIIDSDPNLSRIALIKEGKLDQLHYEDNVSDINVGDIYLARVVSVKDGLNGAFLNIGQKQHAFLHYTDLGSHINVLKKLVTSIKTKREVINIDNINLNTPIHKSGTISDVLKSGDEIIVQILKEPIHKKGARLSCSISMVGSLLILIPLSNQINISKKIVRQSERKRLQIAMASVKPENMGVIIRTLAENKSNEEIEKNLQNLLHKWQQVLKNLRYMRGPGKLLGEDTRLNALLRDLLGEGLDSVIISSEKIYEQVKKNIESTASDFTKIVKLYTGSTKIFEFYGIEKKIKALFGRHVFLPSGGYLIIEHTEAMHVIDVNSGQVPTGSQDQETTALLVNTESVKEIARQLRLRDMGGIICIDLIDMRLYNNREFIYKLMHKEMKADRAISTILPISRFGIMQITRQRIRPQLNIRTKEQCTSCNGTGFITASIVVSDQIEHTINYLFIKQNEKYLTLNVHPYLAAFLKKGLFSIQIKWAKKYLRWVKITTDSSLGINKFNLYDKNGTLIKIAGATANKSNKKSKKMILKRKKNFRKTPNKTVY